MLTINKLFKIMNVPQCHELQLFVDAPCSENKHVRASALGVVRDGAPVRNGFEDCRVGQRFAARRQAGVTSAAVLPPPRTLEIPTQGLTTL